jgi:hypothetical protein
MTTTQEPKFLRAIAQDVLGWHGKRRGKRLLKLCLMREEELGVKFLLRYQGPQRTKHKLTPRLLAEFLPGLVEREQTRVERSAVTQIRKLRLDLRDEFGQPIHDLAQRIDQLEERLNTMADLLAKALPKLGVANQGALKSA